MWSPTAQVRLPVFLCYTPVVGSPSPRALPAQPQLVAAHSAKKLSPDVVLTWAGVATGLRAHLRVRAPAAARRGALLAPFAALGVGECDSAGPAGPCVELVARARTEPHDQVLRKWYGSATLSLEPWPYAGTTNTLEALHSGVPIVTRSHPRCHATNVPTSIVTALGLPELSTATREHYASLAHALATSPLPQRLSAALRPLLRSSLLLDGATHTAHLEELYEAAARRFER